MRRTILFATLISSISIMAQNKIKYPVTKKIDHKDVYFGTEINDVYRWLEDDRSKETENWVKAQNVVTYKYLDQIPFRKQIKERMEKLWNYEKISAPFVEGKYTYFYKNNGLQNQSVLYRKDASGKEEIFLDPNTFSKDGTTSLAGINFTQDGSLVAYQISEAGSDWRKVIVLNAVTKEKIGETLVDVKFSGISWFKNEGFYYSSYDKPTGSELSAKTDQHKLYYHKLGTKQTEDKVVFGGDKKRRYVGGQVTEDNKYLVITAANATSSNELYVVDLSNEKFEIKTIVDSMDFDYDFIDNKGSMLYFVTNNNAPNKKLIIIDVNNSEASNWIKVIPETENVLSVTTGGGYIFANYMKDAISVVKQYDYEGSLISEVNLPGIGTASGFGGKKEEKIVYYTFMNYITPSSIYSFDVQTGKSALYQKPKVDFKSEDYESTFGF